MKENFRPHTRCRVLADSLPRAFSLAQLHPEFGLQKVQSPMVIALCIFKKKRFDENAADICNRIF